MRLRFNGYDFADRSDIMHAPNQGALNLQILP